MSDETDDELLARAKAGDREAFSQLYERHRTRAHHYATSLTRDPMRAGDLVSDAFIKIMTLVDQGRGPESNFGGYLTMTIRNTHIDSLRGRRHETLVDDVALFGHLEPPADDPADGQAEASVVTRAFLSLPQRWREVLWYTEVHDEPFELVASRFGIKKNAVSALSFRAREGLRQSYLAEHLALTKNRECQSCAPLIPPYLRGQLSSAKTETLERHLGTCEHCPTAVGELEKLSTSLGAMIAPVVVFKTGLTLGQGGSGVTKTGLAGWKISTAVAAGVVTVAGVLVWRTDPGAAPPPVSAPAPATTPTPSLSPPPAPLRPKPSATPTPTTPPSAPSSTPLPPAPTPSEADPTPTPTRTPTPAVTTPALGDVRVDAVRAGEATSAKVTATVSPAGEELEVTVDVANAAGFSLESAGWTCQDRGSSAATLHVVCRAPSTRARSRGLVFRFSVVDPRHAARGALELRSAGTSSSRPIIVEP